MITVDPLRPLLVVISGRFRSLSKWEDAHPVTVAVLENNFSALRAFLWPTNEMGPGAPFSKVPIINGPGKLFPFTLKIEVPILLHLT